MQQAIKRVPPPRFTPSTEEEDARITAAALSDPDALPLNTEQLAKLTRRRGRPLSEVTKVATSLRLDLDIVNAFKLSGQGWQTRINEVLREYIDAHDMRQPDS